MNTEVFRIAPSRLVLSTFGSLGDLRLHEGVTY